MDINEEVEEVLTEAAEELNEEETIMTEYDNTLQSLYNQYQTINQMTMQTISEFSRIGVICENNISLLQEMVEEYSELDLSLKKTVVDESDFNKELIEREVTLKEINQLMKTLNIDEMLFNKTLLKREEILKLLSKLTEELVVRELSLNKNLIRSESILKNLNKIMESIRLKEVALNKELKIAEQLLSSLNKMMQSINLKEANLNKELKITEQLLKNLSKIIGGMGLKEASLNKELKITEQLLKNLNKLSSILDSNLKNIDKVIGKLPSVFGPLNNEIKNLNSEMENLNKALNNQEKNLENVKKAFSEMNETINIRIIENYSEAVKKANDSSKKLFDTTINSAPKAKKSMSEWIESTWNSIVKFIEYLGDLADALNSLREFYDEVTNKEERDQRREARVAQTSTGEMEGDMEALETDDEVDAVGIEGTSEAIEFAMDSMMGPIGIAIMGITVLVEGVMAHFSELKKIAEEAWHFVSGIGDDIVKKIHSWGFAELPEKEFEGKKKIHHIIASEFLAVPTAHNASNVPIVMNEGFMSGFSLNMPELNNIDFEGVTDKIIDKMMLAIDTITKRPIVTKVQMNDKTIVEATHKEFSKVNGQDAELQARMRGVLFG